MDNILLLIIVATAISIFLNTYLKKHGVPTIIGYIISGAAIGVIFDLKNVDSHVLHEIAEFGIVFLMFTIGLEFSINHLKTMKKEVFINGSLQVLVSGIIFSQIAYHIFGLDEKSSLIVAAAIALSSTAIVLKTLSETGEISKPYGRLSLGVLLLQDIAVVPILLMITLFTQTGTSVEALLGKTFISGVVTLGILYVFGKYVLSYVFKKVIDAKSHEIFITTILLVVVSASTLAHYFGFSYSLGAFIAGILIAETTYKHQIEADLAPFRDVLLGVFFVAVGMQIDLGYFFSNIFLILALAVGMMVLKAIIIAGVIRSVGVKIGTLKTAITLSQVGEFSFAVFELAKKEGLLANEIAQPLVMAVVLSMIVTPFILKNIDTIALFFESRGRTRDEEMCILKPSKIENHVVICGYGILGQEVASMLKRMDIPYIAVDMHRQLVEEGIKRGDAVIFGNAAQRSILNEVHVKTCSAVIIAIDDEHKTRLVSQSVLELAPRANIIVKVSNANVETEIDDLPITHVVDQHEEVAKVLIDHAITCKMANAYIPKVCRDCKPEAYGKPSDSLGSI